MSINTYLIVATVIFLFLTLIWTTKTWLNVIIKFLFAIMTAVGVYLIIVHRLLTFLN